MQCISFAIFTIIQAWNIFLLAFITLFILPPTLFFPSSSYCYFNNFRSHTLIRCNKNLFNVFASLRCIVLSSVLLLRLPLFRLLSPLTARVFRKTLRHNERWRVTLSIAKQKKGDTHSVLWKNNTNVSLPWPFKKTISLFERSSFRQNNFVKCIFCCCELLFFW